MYMAVFKLEYFHQYWGTDCFKTWVFHNLPSLNLKKGMSISVQGILTLYYSKEDETIFLVDRFIQGI